MVVNEGLAGGGRGDERRDSGVVERAWQPQTLFVHASHSVVSKQWIGAPDQGQVVTEVLCSLSEIHWREWVTASDALIQRPEAAQSQLTS